MTAHDLLPTQGMDVEEPHEAYLDATVEFEEAARYLDLESWLVQRLRHSEREVTVNIALSGENGQPASLTGLRVQHNSSRGALLGGVMLARDAHLMRLRAQAMARTWQYALFDLPFGGAAGAVVCSPQQMPERDLRAACVRYVEAMRDLMGAGKDILAPDLGANERTMAWMLASYLRMGGTEPAAVMGKPSLLGGWSGRDQAGAHVVMALLRQVLAERHASLGVQRVAVQGFGKVGAGVARQLHDSSARVVAVADISGGLVNPKGINIPALQAFAARNGVLFGFPEAEAVCNADVLEAECDILITAAVERQITTVNAARIQASAIFEAAPAAVTRGAETILAERHVLVVPDILASAGEGLADFVEWAQCRRPTLGMTGGEQAVSARAEDAYRAVRAMARRQETSLRGAAHLLAVEKVAAAVRMQEI